MGRMDICIKQKDAGFQVRVRKIKSTEEDAEESDVPEPPEHENEIVVNVPDGMWIRMYNNEEREIKGGKSGKKNSSSKSAHRDFCKRKGSSIGKGRGYRNGRNKKSLKKGKDRPITYHPTSYRAHSFKLKECFINLRKLNIKEDERVKVSPNGLIIPTKKQNKQRGQKILTSDNESLDAAFRRKGLASNQRGKSNDNLIKGKGKAVGKNKCGSKWGGRQVLDSDSESSEAEDQHLNSDRHPADSPAYPPFIPGSDEGSALRVKEKENENHFGHERNRNVFPSDNESSDTEDQQSNDDQRSPTFISKKEKVLESSIKGKGNALAANHRGIGKNDAAKKTDAGPSTVISKGGLEVMGIDVTNLDPVEAPPSNPSKDSVSGAAQGKVN